MSAGGAMAEAASAMKTTGHAIASKVAFGSTALFTTDVARLGELRESLEGNVPREQLEAMRRLVGMLSKDIDVSACFPSVVKLVVADNAELKRLAHMYLVHYADVEPDTILLCINTFQKDMRGPNQLIRASALRVMSSIRVKMIIQPVVLAIRGAIIDSSAYVRKAACAALLKVHSVDPTLKDELADILTSLLKDSSPLVLGSAVSVFLELCPERHDILHRVFRKLCHMIADMDEWGQVSALQLLLRYAKTQFLDPDPEAHAAREEAGDDKEDGDDENEDDDEDVDAALGFDVSDIDPDHRLLLNSTLPLLQSHASSVVYATATLHLELAPPNEHRLVGRALCRILRSSREAQWIALHQCATLASCKPGVLRPFITEFFVSQDAPAAAKMKLEILTHLVDETNITKLLREFAAYVKHQDKEFVRATIQAIGRCATRIPAVLNSCIASLMRLLSNRNEDVVAEAVIVLKRLLQTPAAEDSEAVIRQLARLLDTIAVPTARAAITWLCGEYHNRIEQYAPDVLRVLAKSFALEDEQVKLQIVTLGAKLFVARPDDVRILFEYVLTLAKYDQSYDVRDRARLLRLLLLGDKSPSLGAHAERLLQTTKPVPVYRSEFAARAQWTLGTLSHILGQDVDGYEPLAPFPTTQPDRSTRDNEFDLSSIGQSMSSDTGGGGYIPSTSHQGNQGAQTGFSKPAPAPTGDVFGDENLDSFYDDEYEGEEGDEDYGYWGENDEWVWYTKEELQEYYGEDGGGDLDEYYDDRDDDSVFDANIASEDEAYLVVSGELPGIGTVDDFVPEEDDAEGFWN